MLPLKPGSLFSVVQTIRRQKPFDVAILFPNSLRAALEVWFAGIPRRVGFRGHDRRWLLNQIVTEEPVRGPIQHQVYRYMGMVRELGGRRTRNAKFLPRIKRRAGETRLCPGRNTVGQALAARRFAESRSIIEERPIQWVLFGTAADLERGAPSINLGAHCVNRITKPPDKSAAELGECALLLTNDTGRCLATLIGVPVVAIFKPPGRG